MNSDAHNTAEWSAVYAVGDLARVTVVTLQACPTMSRNSHHRSAQVSEKNRYRVTAMPKKRYYFKSLYYRD